MKNIFTPFLLILLLISLTVSVGSAKAAESSIIWKQPNRQPGTLQSSEKGLYNAVALGQNSAYFVGSREVSSLFGTKDAWRIEKRNRIDGVGATIPTSNDEGSAIDVTADSSSNFYVTGYNTSKLVIPFIITLINNDWILKKYNSSGSAQWTAPNMPSGSEVSVLPIFNFLFGSSKVSTSPYAMSMDDTGIYIAGVVSNTVSVIFPITDDSSWVVQKRSPVDGSLIWSEEYSNPSVFGFPVPNPTSQYVMVPRDVVASNGKVYVGGFYYDNSSKKIQSLLVRFNASDGSQMIAKENDLGTNKGHIEALAVYDGNLYVAGNEFDSSSQNSKNWIVQKRNLGSLNIDSQSIGGDSEYPSDYELVKNMAVGPLGIYLAGETTNGSNTNWHLERRSLEDLSRNWEINDDYVSGKDDSASALAVDKTEIYAGGIQESGYYRAELRGDVYNCQLGLVPIVNNPPSNLTEGQTNSFFSIGNSDQSSSIFCSCPNATIAKTSGSDGVISFGANPTPLGVPLSITAGTISSCSEDFSYQASCAGYTPANFDIRVIKTCATSCSPLEQDVPAGGTARITAEGDLPGSSFDWTVASGLDYVESPLSNPTPNQLDLTLTADSAWKSVTVDVHQDCCGTASCKINSLRAGWVEMNQ
jgi:hypothetical protein